MPRAGTIGTAAWSLAGILMLLCLSPFLYGSFTTSSERGSPLHPQHRWQFQPSRQSQQQSDQSHQRRALAPDASRGPAHQGPAQAPPQHLSPDAPHESSGAELLGQSSFLGARNAHHEFALGKRDGPLRCDDGPCVDGSCCSKDKICGFGPDHCGDGCRSNCTATAMCGEYSENAEMPCGMKLCCSAMGWCGTTASYCHNADPLRGTLPCQAGYGSCYITPEPPGCPYGGGSTNARMVGYYQSWNVRNRACNKVAPSHLNTTGYTHLFYSFASVDPVTFRIAHAHSDDPDMMREFTGLKKDGLQTWIAIGGFDFSDPGMRTHTTWSDLCATKERRAEFIRSVKEYMDEYGFQGVDLDWEYPGDPGRGGNKLADTRNLVLLVREMRMAYGSAYGISLTLAPDYWYLRWFDPKAMEPYVDFFGFMAYDLHGSWDADVLALGKKVRGQADIREIANNTVPLWFDGLDFRKINFGLAMYGRGYTLADPSCNQLLCPFSGPSDPAPCTNFPGVMSLHEIYQLIQRKGLTPQYLADSMMKQITWDDQWIGYDDDETFAAKKAWADSKCFGGTMVWSIDFQVSGSGDSDGAKYGDIVYIGSEVFETPTAQCPAPCIMVFPSSTLPEPKVITMEPYTATLEVGTTTTTMVAVATASTTTVTVLNFFNHYVTSGQQPGAAFTLRPSFQAPPVMLVVTGQDSQTTTRTVLPPPVGGPASYSSAPNATRTSLIGTATLTPNPAWPYIPPATPTPKIEDDDEFLVEPLPTFEDGDDDDTEWPVGLVEPVTDKDKSPPPNGSRVSCKTWFFFICIDWPELNIKVDFWDIVLPPGKIGPGPPPIHLLKLPTGWRVGCLELHCLPPWPEVTVGANGVLPPPPATPVPCEPTTATLTIESTSYGTTSTDGTIRTTASATFSREFPILGCALTDATIATTTTACDAPQRRAARATSAASAAGYDQTPEDAGAGVALDVRSTDNELAARAPTFCFTFWDVVLYPVNHFDAATDLKKKLSQDINVRLAAFEVVESTDPVFVAFFYLTKAQKTYVNELTTGNYGINTFYEIMGKPLEPPVATKRSSADAKAGGRGRGPSFAAAHNGTETAGHKHSKRLEDMVGAWALSHLSVPPKRDWLSEQNGYIDYEHELYTYRRHESQCAGQYVYIIEDQIDFKHTAFDAIVDTPHAETLPEKIYGNWLDWEDRQRPVASWHATKIASIVASQHIGVCGSQLTLVSTRANTMYPWGIYSHARQLKLLEALVTALHDIKTKGRGSRSVINMSWGFDPSGRPFEECLLLVLKELDKLNAVLVTASGNADKTKVTFDSEPDIDTYPQLWADGPLYVRLIVVGSSTSQSRAATNSKRSSSALTCYAPGKDVAVASHGGGYEFGSGTSYAAPHVAGLVAYFRALPGLAGPLTSTEEVFYLLKKMSRTVQLGPDLVDKAPFQGDDGNDYGYLVETVWNGQNDDDVSCLVHKDAPGCPPLDLNDGDTVEELCELTPITKKRGFWGFLSRRQQTGCVRNPGQGGGDGGSDGGVQDQLGPSKTFTYLSGTPSPTCTSGCGTLCTDWWCRPDRTGQPLHFTEPTRLPTTTLPPIGGGGGQPCPDGAVAHTSTACVGSGGRVVCGPVTSCFDLPALPPPTSCATSSTSTRCVGSGGKLVCGVETVCVTPTLLPAPTTCTDGWVASTVDFCNGSGGKQVCGQSMFCVTTPKASPTYRVVNDSKCPGAGEVCVRKRVVTSCDNKKARGLPEPTLAALPAVGGDSVLTADAPPPTLAPGAGYGAGAAAPMPVQGVKKPVIKAPRRPLPESLRQIHELQVSPVPTAAENMLLAARQQVCSITVTCETCQAPKPNVPDPCIEIKMLAVATGLGGTQISAELSVNGRIVCRPSNLCGVDEQVEDCWGADNYDCGSGNRLDWRGEFFSFYVRANDKTYDIEVKVTKEGVYDPCGTGRLCLAWIFRGKTGPC